MSANVGREVGSCAQHSLQHAGKVTVSQWAVLRCSMPPGHDSSQRNRWAACSGTLRACLTASAARRHPSRRKRANLGPAGQGVQEWVDARHSQPCATPAQQQGASMYWALGSLQAATTTGAQGAPATMPLLLPPMEQCSYIRTAGPHLKGRRVCPGQLPRQHLPQHLRQG